MALDERDRLKEQPFDYKQTKAGKLMIYFEHRLIMTVSEKQSKKTIMKLEHANDFDEQLILAKVTGHFKHGNER